jgi:hypothetical protein
MQLPGEWAPEVVRVSTSLALCDNLSMVPMFLFVARTLYNLFARMIPPIATICKWGSGKMYYL